MRKVIFTILFLIGIISLSSLFWFRSKDVNKGANNVNSVEKLVERFEELNQKRDPAILRLFTPPVTREEKGEYDFLMGSNLPYRYPRLYLTNGFGYRTVSFKIKREREENKRKILEIEEKREFFDNTNGKWSSAESVNLLLEIIEDKTGLKVENYYQKNQPRGKYNGFYV